MDQVEDERLEREAGVERRVECDGDAVGARHGPALLTGLLDEDLVGPELVVPDPEAAGLELVELAAGEGFAHVAQRRAELRPQHRQVRFHPELARIDVAEFDLFHAQLLSDLVGVRAGPVRAGDDDPAQRLPELQPRRRTRLTAELDDLPHRRHLRVQRLIDLARLRPRVEEDRLVLRDDVLPEMLGEERHHRCDHLERRAQRLPQHAQRRLVAVPEPAPRTPDVPVRQIVDETLERIDDAGRPVALVVLGHLSHEGRRPRGKPAVERP